VEDLIGELVSFCVEFETVVLLRYTCHHGQMNDRVVDWVVVVLGEGFVTSVNL
jgi:hypothetical protein